MDQVSLGFRPRFNRIDALIRQAVEARGIHVVDDEHLWLQPALALSDIFPPVDWLPRHFGTISRVLWNLSDQVFKAADSLEDCPPGALAKSVQVADVYELVVPSGARNTFLVLWFTDQEPVLVPAPEIAAVLLDPADARLSETRTALHALVWEITERLNIAMPAARALAAFHTARQY